MPHFTLGLTPEGPVIDLVVMASQPRVDALKSAGLPIPTPVALRCLIDTGASGTCFDAAAIVARSPKFDPGAMRDGGA